MQSAFVTNLRSFREAAGLSQISLAQRAGLSQGFLADIERGAKFPSPQTIEKLSNALSVRPFQFFVTAEDVERASGSALAAEYLEKLRGSLDQQIQDAIDVMKPPPTEPEAE